MTKKRALKTTSLEAVKDEFIGKMGTPKRDQYELELKLDIGLREKIFSPFYWLIFSYTVLESLTDALHRLRFLPCLRKN